MYQKIGFTKKWNSFTLLIIGIVLTLAAAFYTNKESEMIVKQDFALVCNEIKAKITLRLYTHAQLLRSGSSFFAAKEVVSRKDWKKFIESSKLNRNLPGVQGVGFSVIIEKEHLQQHIQQIRQEGFSEYTVFPAGERGIYTSITYIEPFTDRNLRAFGYDMYSEPIRRRAMEQARDYDIAALSGKVVLLQETDEDVQAGTLMYVPVYQNGMPTNTIEERRASILGWVYSPYRMVDLMKGILGSRGLIDKNKIHLQVYDNEIITQNSLLFDSQIKDTLDHNDEITESLSLPVLFNEKKWTLKFSKSKGKFAYVHNKVLIVLFGGFIISLLLFYLSLTLINTRLRAQQIAAKLALEVKESETRFSLFMDYLPVSTFIKDKYGRNLFFNRHLIDLMGFKDWENKLNSDIIDENEALRVSDDDIKAFEQGDYKFEETLMDGSGCYRIYETRKFVIPRQGQDPLLGGISSDITERKEYEGIKEEIEINLRKINASKDKFFSIIGHDLKSPFNSIISFSELLLQQVKDKNFDGIDKYADIILKSSNRAMDLLLNLIEWSQLQTGKMEFNPVHFDLVACINKITLLFDEIARQKSITIKNNLPQKVSVFADHAMISTVLRNLISNAIKFTMPGGDITISVLQKQNEILFSVSDTGVGIPTNCVEKLFRIDQSFSTAGTNKETGTGLGLILCKDFVEKHNGEIRIESDQAKGTTIYFTLPVNAG